MALGQLVVRLGLDAAEFVSGMSKSEAQAKRFAESVERGLAGAFKASAVAATALVAATGAAAVAFQKLVGGAAAFKDLEETTGASAENIASFGVAAATAGVQIEDVAGSMNKLTKNLVGVDDESKAAGAALKALGLNVEQFKQLDPAAQYEAIGRALSGFADGAGKVAVAQALFGKSGAEQLKVFKALEEAGGRQTILTQHQIELADAYADKQAKSAASLRLYAQAAATEAIPALTDLTKALTSVVQELLGVDKAGKQISANSAVKDFAEGAADSAAFLADALVAAGRVALVVGGTVRALAADVELLGKLAIAASPARGGLLFNTDEIKEALAERNRVVDQAGQALDNLLNKDAARFRNALKAAREESAASAASAAAADPSDARFSRKPSIEFGGVDTEAIKARKAAAAAAASEAKKAAADVDRYIEGLNKQLTATYDLTAAEKVLQDIRTGELKGGVVTQQVALRTAEEIDANKELNRLVRERADFKNRDYQAGNDAAAANALADQARLTNLLAGTEQTLFDKRQSDLVVLQNALASGKIEADQYGQAVKDLFNIVDEGAKDSKRAMDELNMSFQSAFEDAIVDGKKFGDVLKALEKDLIRIALRKAVIEPAANSLTAGLGSLFGGGGSTGGGQFVGPPELATGMNYVPYDGYIASLHKGERVVPAAEASQQRRANSGGDYVIEYHGPPMRTERRTDPNGDKRLILSVVDEEISRGGSTAQRINRMGSRPRIQR